MSEYIQVITSVAERAKAEELARSLVERRLAACAQVLGPIESTYWWKGSIERAEEWLVLAKSRRKLYKRIEEAILSQHPYSVPEVLAVPIIGGHRAYLEWLKYETH